jgi:riboflavin biosynthesis pyrimidine reductase
VQRFGVADHGRRHPRAGQVLTLEPLEALFEAPDLSGFPFPPSLRTLYAGTLGFPPARLYANFVSSLDGVVAIEPLSDSSSIISGGSEADRFVMGLLRTCADAVVIGAGTFRAAPGHRWTPGYIYPDEAEAFDDLRTMMGRAGGPQLVVITERGTLDPGHPALEGALILTTKSGAQRLRGRLSKATLVEPLGDDEALDPEAILGSVRAAGHQVLLCEGGPTLLGHFLRAGLVDELFLTLSPVIAGRADGSSRPSFVARTEFPPTGLAGADLLSVRRSRSHLFLRYETLASRSRRASMASV